MIPPTHDSAAAADARDNCWGGCGYCLRCGFPWKGSDYHVTMYDPGDSGEPFVSGAFPLCEDCWAGLTIEERLPYYMDLVREWIKDGADDVDERRVAGLLAAVRAGR